MHPNHSTQPCKACGAPASVLPAAAAVHPLVRCTVCGFRSIADPETVNDVSVEQSESEYLQSYSKDFRRVADRRVAMVRECAAPPARCLDFGSSYGLIAERLTNAGYSVATFEKSPQALASMKKRGLKVYSEVSDLPVSSFEVITVWHVLEHLEEPAAVLSRLVESLRRGGSLLVAVPNAGGLFAKLSFEHWIWTMPWHLHYFTGESLHRLLERGGLTIKSLYTDSGDVAALESLAGGMVLRTPSRLSRRSSNGAAAGAAQKGRLRRIAAPALRTISAPMQAIAKRFALGEELIVHAVKP